jgi:hypothetical protein
LKYKITKPTKLTKLFGLEGKLANRQFSGGRPVGQTAIGKSGFEGFAGFVRKRK